MDKAKLTEFIKENHWLLLFTRTRRKTQDVYLTPAGALVDVWSVGDKVFAVNTVFSVGEQHVLRTH